MVVDQKKWSVVKIEHNLQELMEEILKIKKGSACNVEVTKKKQSNQTNNILTQLSHKNWIKLNQYTLL